MAVAGRRCFPQDDKGKTALMLAAQKGSLEICQLLVQNNADVNATAWWCREWRGQGAVRKT